MTPDEVLAALKRGNANFSKGLKTSRNYLAEQKASAKGQYPSAIILSCVDSRAPAEIVMDLGIGDVFNARVAGNIATTTFWAAWNSPASFREQRSSW
jgi:carbonic anhydrase